MHVEINVPQQLRIAFSLSSSEHTPLVRDEDVRNKPNFLTPEARVNNVNAFSERADAAEPVRQEHHGYLGLLVDLHFCGQQHRRRFRVGPAAKPDLIHRFERTALTASGTAGNGTARITMSTLAASFAVTAFTFEPSLRTMSFSEPGPRLFANKTSMPLLAK